jgi:hypothetical protein
MRQLCLTILTPATASKATAMMISDEEARTYKDPVPLDVDGATDAEVAAGIAAAGRCQRLPVQRFAMRHGPLESHGRRRDQQLDYRREL